MSWSISMLLEHKKKKKKKLIACLTFCLVTCQQYQLSHIQRQVHVRFWASASTFNQYPVSIPADIIVVMIYYTCHSENHLAWILSHPFCCLHWHSLKTPFQILSRTLFLISVMVIHEGAGDSLNVGDFYWSSVQAKFFFLSPSCSL